MLQTFDTQIHNKKKRRSFLWSRNVTPLFIFQTPFVNEVMHHMGCPARLAIVGLVIAPWPGGGVNRVFWGKLPS